MRLENIGITALLLVSSTLSYAQKNREKTDVNVPAIASADSVKMPVDSVLTAQDSSNLAKLNQSLKPVKKKRDWSTWHPEAKRAMWMALVLPGAGQIYNRKYWKLPIFYGGMMGCVYALTWNNMMYRDYSQAYLDIMDSDPATQSYNKFLHLGAQITSQNEERYKKLFKSRKDKYRRWRDMSMFCLIGVYALSIIDAYVDAELSEFDISNDLSLKVAPTVIPGGSTFSSGSLENSAVGVNLGLRF